MRYSVLAALCGLLQIACGASSGSAPADSPDQGFSDSVDAGFAASPDLGFVDGGFDDAGRPIDGGTPDSGAFDAGFSPDVGFTPAPAALSTRSLTSHNLGSDPGRITIGVGALSVDLRPLSGATIYRATLDPYLEPTPQRETRRVTFEGTSYPLRTPRKLTFDVTAAVRDAVDRGETQMTLAFENMQLLTVSLDVLCDLEAPTPLPLVSDVAAVHRQGDTMITFAEHQPPLSSPMSTLSEVQQARMGEGPSMVGKTRYRIYRSRRPIDDLGDIIDADLVDEIPPLTGWADEFVGFDIDGAKSGENVEMLPVDDLTPAAPGTGIYVRRHSGPNEAAWYLVRYVGDGAESFESLNATSSVDESTGPGMTLLSLQETIDGDWIFTPNVRLRFDFLVRWSPAGEYPTPSQAFHYRVGVPLDPVSGTRPASIFMHAFGGTIQDWAPWYRYEDGTLLISSNLQQYTSYTAFHESIGTLGAWDEGTAQPYYWARNLSFLFDYAVPQYGIDTDRIILFGASMGGAGTMFWGMRSGHLFSYLEASVGNSIPAEDLPILSEFETFGYGPLDWRAGFSNPQLARFGYPLIQPSDNISVWDYFDSRWWLAQNQSDDLPFLSFANAPNDQAISWGPAWAHANAVMDARQPHQFTWGQDGHGQTTERIELDLRRDQAVVAFSDGSLDDSLGADPQQSPPTGQRNQWYRWDPTSISDEVSQFSVTLFIRNGAPSGSATVDVSPRRRQRFLPSSGSTVNWTYGTQSGQVQVDEAGRITIPDVQIGSTPAELDLTVN